LKLKRKLRGSELVVLPGHGHAVFEETPEQANRIVLDWLDRHPWPTARRRNTPQVVSIRGRNKATAAIRRLSPET
jgi:hypothetical protein